jgi:predicted metalloenzyme YecM
MLHLRGVQLPDPSLFLQRLFEALAHDGIVTDGLPLDHLCYRVETTDRYTAMKALLSENGRCLGEHTIGGRPIATYTLTTPFSFQGRSIEVVELPAPKTGSPYTEGWEHAEFVVDEEPKAFAARYPTVQLGPERRREEEATPMCGSTTAGFSVKFHRRALAEVISGERK